MELNTYLLFSGDCNAALELYQAAFGAQVDTLIRFRDTPAAQHEPPSWQDKVMHSVFRVGSTAIMVSDGRYGEPRKSHHGFTLAIIADDVSSGARIFQMLSERGSVLVDWAPVPWAAGFGVTTDRFGVPWTISVAAPDEA